MTNMENQYNQNNGYSGEEQRARVFCDLIHMALACDLTRVASLQWASTQTGKVFTWLGQNETHHQLSHSSQTDETRRQHLVDIGKWHAELLIYYSENRDS